MELLDIFNSNQIVILINGIQSEIELEYVQSAQNDIAPKSVKDILNDISRKRLYEALYNANLFFCLDEFEKLNNKLIDAFDTSKIEKELNKEYGLEEE